MSPSHWAETAETRTSAAIAVTGSSFRKPRSGHSPCWVAGSAFFGPLGRAYPPLAWAPRMFRGRATFQSLARSPIEGYFNSVSIFRPDEKSQLFSPDFLNSLGGDDSAEVFRHHYDRANTEDPLSRIQYVDMKTYLTDDISDQGGPGQHGCALKVRAPLLDHKLMELVASIPSSLKVRGDQGKYIFKKAMNTTLPHDLLYRPNRASASRSTNGSVGSSASLLVTQFLRIQRESSTSITLARFGTSTRITEPTGQPTSGH